MPRAVGAALVCKVVVAACRLVEVRAGGHAQKARRCALVCLVPCGEASADRGTSTGGSGSNYDRSRSRDRRGADKETQQGEHQKLIVIDLLCALPTLWQGATDLLVVKKGRISGRSGTRRPDQGTTTPLSRAERTRGLSHLLLLNVLPRHGIMAFTNFVRRC